MRYLEYTLLGGLCYTFQCRGFYSSFFTTEDQFEGVFTYERPYDAGKN